MGKHEKIKQLVLCGKSDANIHFADLCGLLRHLGFLERIKGRHHIFTRADLMEIINVQPRAGAMAKPYQIKQIRAILQKSNEA